MPSEQPPRIVMLDAARWSADGSPALLEQLRTAAAVAVRHAVDESTCRGWVQRILEARNDWIADFGGEQFSLGSAFYTHLETGRAAEYRSSSGASSGPGLFSARTSS